MSPKISMWINIGLAVSGAWAAAGALFTTVFGQGEAQIIVASCGLATITLSAVNGALHGYSTSESGPLAK